MKQFLFSVAFDIEGEAMTLPVAHLYNIACTMIFIHPLFYNKAIWLFKFPN
jgi:hypothetical protein